MMNGRNEFFSFTIPQQRFSSKCKTKGNKVEEQNEGLTQREGRQKTQSPAENLSPSLGHLSLKQQRWVPPNSRRHVLCIDRNETIFRKTRSILNKLTPEKFDKLCQEILNIGIDSKVVLKGIVILIYEKAIDELRFSSLYANLCRRLYHEAPNFDLQTNASQGRPPSNLKPNTFRRFLIAKLQDEFENRNKKLESFDSKEDLLSAEEEDQRSRAKQHMLGNIKFICELYRLNLLHESIVHQCIKQLINKKKKGSVDDLAEDLECLCQIMTTCGRRLDHSKAKSLMDQYFERMAKLQKRTSELPSRVRFMLQDVIELRSSEWVPRSVHVSQGPKTLGQIRSEVGEEHPSLLFDTQPSRQNHQPRSTRAHQNAAGLGFFPMSKKQHYDGFSGPLSPPFAPLSNGEPVSPGQGFDFFSPIPPKTNGAKLVPSTVPNPVAQFVPPYMNYANGQQHLPPPVQYNPNSNGFMAPPYYPVSYNQNFAQPAVPSAKAMQMNNSANSQNPPATTQSEVKAVKTKPSRELPPRFQKHKMSRNAEQQAPPNPNIGQPTVVQNLTLKTEKPDRPVFKPLYSPSTSAAIQDNSPSRFSPKTTFRGSPPAVKPTPMISATADTFQPPYQHVIDKAQTQPLRKSSSNPNFEKSKVKKAVLSDKEVLDLINQTVKENVDSWGTKIKNAKIPPRHGGLICAMFYEHSLNGSDADRDKVCSVVLYLSTEKIISKEHRQEALSTVFEKLSFMEEETPRIKSLMASMLGRIVVADLVSLSDVASRLRGGYHFPLFLLTLQQIAKIRDREFLAKIVKESKLEMIEMMPEVSQNKASMLEILETKNLSFLFPLLNMEAKLGVQLDKDPTPQVVYRWIKDNVTLEMYTDPDFIGVLVTSCLQHVTKNSTLAPTAADDAQTTGPGVAQEREKQLLQGIKLVLQKFVHDKPDLQLRALYAVQVFCHGVKFPKGLMLRMFDLLYHEDVIDEEVFLRWKEDVNDDFPGKGKSLFQVNAWLTWLEEADTEDEDEEEG